MIENNWAVIYEILSQGARRLEFVGEQTYHSESIGSSGIFVFSRLLLVSFSDDKMDVDTGLPNSPIKTAKIIDW